MKLFAPIAFAFATCLLAACATPPDLSSLEASVTTREVRVPSSLAPTDFGQAVTQAVVSSPTLGRGNARLREAEAGLIAEGGAFVPQASLGVRPDGVSGFSATGFGSASMLLYDGGASAARETAARARVLAGLAGRYDAGSQAALGAVQAWAEVVTARRIVAANAQTLAALQATAALIEERAAAGTGANSEVLTAQSRLANSRSAAVNAQAELGRAEAVFVEVFGRVPPGRIALPAAAPRPPGLTAEGSPIVYEAQAAVLAAQADHAAALAGRAPSISVTLSALLGADIIAGVASEQLLTPARGRQARVAATQARIDARLTDLDAIERALASRVRIIAAERIASERRREAALDARAANRANLVESRALYEIGRQSLLALLDAEREALEAERQLIRAEHDTAVIGYRALAATGDILDLFGIDVSAQDPRDAVQ